MQHTHQFKNFKIKKILPLFCASLYENICKLYESALMQISARFQSTLGGSEISGYNANVLMNRLSCLQILVTKALTDVTNQSNQH